MKESSGGGSVKTGLSSQEKINTDPKSMGMGNTGPDDKPQATPKQGVSEKGKNFTIR